MIDIGKVNRRFRAHYYTHGKMEQCFDPPEFLLSDGTYPTKIRPDDLPPWYVEYTYLHIPFHQPVAVPAASRERGACVCCVTV